MQHSVAFHQRHPCQNWQYQIPNTKFSISSSSRSPDWAKLRRGYFDFRISCQSLEKEIIITPEPVMILTWNLKHETWHETWPVIKLDMRNKTTSKKKKKKNWWLHHVRKFWSHCHFSNFWSIWSHSDAGFQTHSLENLHFHWN